MHSYYARAEWQKSASQADQANEDIGIEVENSSSNDRADSTLASGHQSAQAHGVDGEHLYSASYAEHMYNRNRHLAAHDAVVYAICTNEKLSRDGRLHMNLAILLEYNVRNSD